MQKNIIVYKSYNKTMIAFLKENMNYSSRKAKSLLRNGLVVLNDKKAYGDSKVKKGDVICFLEEDKKIDNIIPVNLPLSILYEDEFLMAIDKPAFLSVYSAKNDIVTLANGIRYYFDNNDINEPVRFYNRLDRDTSGIVLVPKDGQTHSLLMRISSSDIAKIYKAIVMGVPMTKESCIIKPISQKANKAGKRTIIGGGKKAITRYKVIEAYKKFSLLELTIITGRTHQIRVHMANIGHPIVGDSLYGEPSTLINRQALHATSLDFFHPIKNHRINIVSPLPKDFHRLLKDLKGGV